MKTLTTSSRSTGSIKGFNNECVYVTRVRDGHDNDTWRFWASCGADRMFRPEYFYDPYAAAMNALENHHHA
jgi:hypothetical protein